jgi:glutathione S-transferase
MRLYQMQDSGNCYKVRLAALAPYKAIGAWMERIRTAPGHVPMDWRP